jgi:hypothetical protein
MEFIVKINKFSKAKALKYGLKYDRVTKKWTMNEDNKYKHLFVPVEVFVEPHQRIQAKEDGVYYVKQLKKYYVLAFQKELISKYSYTLSEDEDDHDFNFCSL